MALNCHLAHQGGCVDLVRLYDPVIDRWPVQDLACTIHTYNIQTAILSHTANFNSHSVLHNEYVISVVALDLDLCRRASNFSYKTCVYCHLEMKVCTGQQESDWRVSESVNRRGLPLSVGDTSLGFHSARLTHAWWYQQAQWGNAAVINKSHRLAKWMTLQCQQQGASAPGDLNPAA